MSNMHTSKDGTLGPCKAETPKSCPLGGRHYTADQYQRLVDSNDPRALPTPELDREQAFDLQSSEEFGKYRRRWEAINKQLGRAEVIKEAIARRVEEATKGITDEDELANMRRSEVRALVAHYDINETEVFQPELSKRESNLAWVKAKQIATWQAAGLPTHNTKRVDRLEDIKPADVDASGPNGEFTNVYFAQGDEVHKIVSYTAPDDSTRDGWDELGRRVYRRGGYFTTSTGEQLKWTAKKEESHNVRNVPLGDDYKLGGAWIDNNGLFIQEVDNPVTPAAGPDGTFSVKWGHHVRKFESIAEARLRGVDI